MRVRCKATPCPNAIVAMHGKPKLDFLGISPTYCAVSAAKIEVGPPKLFTAAGIFVINTYGLLLIIPFLLSVLMISLLKFGVLTWLVPIVVMIGTAYFLPYAVGNARVVKMVRALNVPVGQAEESFVVQLTCSPRISSGVRAVLEDADDIGCLRFTASELVFHGDSIKLSVPFDQIEQVRRQNVGLRGLFVYGSRIALVVFGLPGVKSLEFAERSSWLLPTSRRTTRKLFACLSAKAGKK